MKAEGNKTDKSQRCQKRKINYRNFKLCYAATFFLPSGGSAAAIYT